jgi:chromosome segregation ATPase
LKDELKSSKALVGNLKGRVKASEAKINHMVHELKKKECEYARLQERLSKHLRDSSTKNDGKALLDISGSLGKVIGSPAAMSKRQERQDDAVKGIITSFEMRERELQNEVRELKGALASMQEQYIQAVNDAAEKRDRVINDSSSIIDTEFIESTLLLCCCMVASCLDAREPISILIWLIISCRYSYNDCQSIGH